MLKAEDLAGISGKVNYEIIGSANVSDEASRLHEMGRRLGSEGQYDKALRTLAAAHELAPGWPYPVYETAWTYLLMGDDTRAKEKYEEVDKLAPRGFFTSKAALDCLRREQSGEIGAGAYKQFVMLEWVSPPQRETALNNLLRKWPRFPPAWKALANLLKNDADRLEAIEKGLACDPDMDTRGVLLANKALILNGQGKKEEAVAILGTLALDPQSTLETEMIAKFSLAQITGLRK